MRFRRRAERGMHGGGLGWLGPGVGATMRHEGRKATLALIGGKPVRRVLQ